MDPPPDRPAPESFPSIEVVGDQSPPSFCALLYLDYLDSHTYYPERDGCSVRVLRHAKKNR